MMLNISVHINGTFILLINSISIDLICIILYYVLCIRNIVLVFRKTIIRHKSKIENTERI